MRLFIITLLAIIFLTNCHRKRYKEEEERVAVFINNAELDDWASSQTIKQSDNAHSGKYVSKIDSINPYSLGISKAIKDISNKTIDSVIFTYWIFMKNKNADVITVFSIEDSNGNNIEWKGCPLKEKINDESKWVEISETYKIPANTASEKIIKLFVWNKSTDEVLLDDFKITFY